MIHLGCVKISESMYKYNTLFYSLRELLVRVQIQKIDFVIQYAKNIYVVVIVMSENIIVESDSGNKHFSEECSYCSCLIYYNCLENDIFCSSCGMLHENAREGGYVYSGGRGEYQPYSKFTLSMSELEKILLVGQNFTIKTTNKKFNLISAKLLNFDVYGNDIDLTFEKINGKYEFIPLSCCVDSNKINRWYTIDDNECYICIDEIINK